MKKIILKNLSLKEITANIQRAGFSAYRGKQIFHWLFTKGVRSIGEMKNLSDDIKEYLTRNTEIGGISNIEKILSSSDGTKKILYRLSDNNFIEGVLMREKNWWTICVSTQVGCPLGCIFCSTGKGGFIRNLTISEIVDQILITNKEIIQKENSEKIRNVVLMGMGEPFLNTENVIKALRLMVAPDGMALSPRRITVSTAGIIEGIKKLSDANVGVNLAISLNAVDNATRDKLMPINKKYPIEKIITTCKEFPLTNRRRITFEYILIEGINDSAQEAKKLSTLLRGFPCKINLIPFNIHPSSAFVPPTSETIEHFREILSRANFTVAIRYSKGVDILAACGQLAGHIRESTENLSP